jgi:cytidylate kinase
MILRQGLTAAKAREFVEQSDRQRNAFIEKYFHHNVADPHIHDLVVNVEQLVQDEAVSLIVDAVQLWLKRTGMASRAPSPHMQSMRR